MKWLLFLVSFNVCGAELGIEHGQSTVWFSDARYYTPATYGAVTVRFDNVELIQGGWAGENSSRFIGGSHSLRSKGKFFAEGGVGGVYLITPKTSQLDGRGQFIFTVGVGCIIDDLVLTGKIRHFSNGSTQKTNKGFEVILGSIGVMF